MTELLADLGLIGYGVLHDLVFIINTFYAKTPLFLLIFGIMFLGACIGIFGRLLSRD